MVGATQLLTRLVHLAQAPQRACAQDVFARSQTSHVRRLLLSCFRGSGRVVPVEFCFAPLLCLGRGGQTEALTVSGVGLSYQLFRFRVWAVPIMLCECLASHEGRCLGLGRVLNFGLVGRLVRPDRAPLRTSTSVDRKGACEFVRPHGPRRLPWVPDSDEDDISPPGCAAALPGAARLLGIGRFLLAMLISDACVGVYLVAHRVRK